MTGFFNYPGKSRRSMTGFFNYAGSDKATSVPNRQMGTPVPNRGCHDDERDEQRDHAIEKAMGAQGEGLT